MLVRGVIKDQVKHQADALTAQILRQCGELLHRPQRWVDLAVAADSITAIVLAFRDLEQRHEVQVGQAKLLEIGDFFTHTC